MSCKNAFGLDLDTPSLILARLTYAIFKCKPYGTKDSSLVKRMILISLQNCIFRFLINKYRSFCIKIALFQSKMITKAMLSVPSVVRMSVRGKALQNWARPSIGELGVPTEPWLRVHENNQKKFSVQLLVGVAVFSITAVVAYNSVETNSKPYHLLKN